MRYIVIIILALSFGQLDAQAFKQCCKTDSIPAFENCDSVLVWYIDYPPNGVNYKEWLDLPHDTVSNIWNGLPDSTGMPTHYNATITEQGVTNDWNKGDAADHQQYWGYIDTEGLGEVWIREKNANTGERIWPFLSTCLAGLLAYPELTTNTPPQPLEARGYGVINKVPEGIHYLGILLSDLSANGGVDVEYSVDSISWTNFPGVRSYTGEPKVDCKRVDNCTYELQEGESYTKIDIGCSNYVGPYINYEP